MYSIRPMRSADQSAVEAIFEAGMRHYCDPLPAGSVLKRSWERYIQAALASDLADIQGVYFGSGGHFWCVEAQSGEICGIVGAESKGSTTIELRRMSVSAKARKAGLGLRLVTRVEDFAATHGFTEVVLSTGSIMAPAIALYHRAGFELYEKRWAEGKFKTLLDAAGEHFFEALFRKPVVAATATSSTKHNDNDAAYGVVPVLYRNPASCNELPEVVADSNAARTQIPQLPGFGTEKLGKPVKVQVQMLDGYKLLAKGERPSFDQHSFMYAKQRLQYTGDWEDIPAVRDQYLPEVEALVREQVPGAAHPGAKVLVFDHAIRTHNRGMKDKPNGHGWGGYANIAHTDATVRSLHSRCKDQVLGTTETIVKYQGVYPEGWGDIRPSLEWQERLFRAEDCDHKSPAGRGGEHMIVNVWRPIQQEPVENWSLCALDGSTLAQGDVHPTTIVRFNNAPGGRIGGTVAGHGSQVVDLSGNEVPVRLGETTTPLHAPHHRWIFFPRMTRDEVLLLKVFDSRRDGRTRCGCHTAFFDPHADPKAFRESIETRCLVILPPEDKTPPHFIAESVVTSGYGGARL